MATKAKTNGQFFFVGENFGQNRSAKFRGFAHTAPQHISGFVDKQEIAEYKAWVKQVSRDNYYTIIEVTKGSTDKNGEAYLCYRVVKEVNQELPDQVAEFMDKHAESIIAIYNLPKGHKIRVDWSKLNTSIDKRLK
jgi:hypothetical protein